ncbi:hypothetical protein SNEBB_007794 [Seison nebaliae]|nr:hypothetical protein SNEBB_007794 [Seison nebaliae]
MDKISSYLNGFIRKLKENQLVLTHNLKSDPGITFGTNRIHKPLTNSRILKMATTTKGSPIIYQRSIYLYTQSYITPKSLDLQESSLIDLKHKNEKPSTYLNKILYSTTLNIKSVSSNFSNKINKISLTTTTTTSHIKNSISTEKLYLTTIGKRLSSIPMSLINDRTKIRTTTTSSKEIKNLSERGKLVEVTSIPKVIPEGNDDQKLNKCEYYFNLFSTTLQMMISKTSNETNKKEWNKQKMNSMNTFFKYYSQSNTSNFNVPLFEKIKRDNLNKSRIYKQLTNQSFESWKSHRTNSILKETFSSNFMYGMQSTANPFIQIISTTQLRRINTSSAFSDHWTIVSLIASFVGLTTILFCIYRSAFLIFTKSIHHRSIEGNDPNRRYFQIKPNKKSFNGSSCRSERKTSEQTTNVYRHNNGRRRNSLSVNQGSCLDLPSSSHRTRSKSLTDWNYPIFTWLNETRLVQPNQNWNSYSCKQENKKRPTGNYRYDEHEDRNSSSEIYVENACQQWLPTKTEKMNGRCSRIYSSFESTYTTSPQFLVENSHLALCTSVEI